MNTLLKVQGTGRRWIKNIASKNIMLWVLALAGLFLVPSLHAANRYSMTITITNNPVTGNTLVFTAPVSKTITWTNNTTSVNVTTNTTIGGASTNLFLHFATYAVGSPRLAPAISSSNIITLSGENDQLITATAGGTWCSITYRTNVITSMVTVRVPIASEIGTTNSPTWIASELVKGQSDLSTNSFAAASLALTNHVNLSIAQTVGNKTITNSYVKASTGSDGTWTNFVNVGNALRSDGSGANSLQLGSNALAKGSSSVAIGNNSLATNANTVALGTTARATNANGTAIGNSAFAYGANSVAVGGSTEAEASAVAFGFGSIASGVSSIAAGNGADVSSTNGIGIGTAASVSGLSAIAIGASSTAVFRDSIAIGTSSSTTTTNQVRLGGSIDQVSSAGIFTGNSHSNTTFYGTNVFRANTSVGFVPFALSSLATGNNAAVPIATNVICEIASGPGAAFTINGISSVGVIPGQIVWLVNLTGFNMTIAHQSGTDPTAANRIITMTGADHTTTANGTAQLYYSTTQSRWILLNLEP